MGQQNYGKPGSQPPGAVGTGGKPGSQPPGANAAGITPATPPAGPHDVFSPQYGHISSDDPRAAGLPDPAAAPAPVGGKNSAINMGGVMTGGQQQNQTPGIIPGVNQQSVQAAARAGVASPQYQAVLDALGGDSEAMNQALNTFQEGGGTMGIDPTGGYNPGLDERFLTDPNANMSNYGLRWNGMRWA